MIPELKFKQHSLNLRLNLTERIYSKKHEGLHNFFSLLPSFTELLSL